MYYILLMPENWFLLPYFCKNYFAFAKSNICSEFKKLSGAITFIMKNLFSANDSLLPISSAKEVISFNFFFGYLLSYI